MGGFGSGRTEYADTPTVAECLSIDADDLIQLTTHPDATGVIHWGDPEDPRTQSVTWRTMGCRGFDGDDRADRVQFRYTTTHSPSETQTDVAYLVRFDYTKPEFGGVRPWFSCPECETRRRKLYLPPCRSATRFLCRECYDLGYQSSRASGNAWKRAEQRYRAAFAKADAEDRRPHPNAAPYSPTKPAGMHSDTFADLRAAVQEARDEWSERADERLWALIEQHGE